MAKSEYLAEMCRRYRKTRDRVSKTAIIDEICATTGFHRKHVLRTLRKHPKRKRMVVRKGGRPSLYAWPTLHRALVAIWLAANMPCGKRLKAMIPLWLPGYEATHSTLDPDVRTRLLNASAATLDRLLKKTRAKHTRHGRATTKPGTLLRRTIPIATDQWKETRLGFLEADTVAHCGTTTAGQFAYSLTCVDLASGWTEQRAVWSKTDKEVVAQLKDIERALPFSLRGFDADNGTEFINHAVLRHLIDRKQPVQMTRSRAYCSDDNAHVEQKNWTHVRQWLGYDRLDNPSVIAVMNNLYANEWRLLHNFYMPSVKLQTKERIGSKTSRTHDAPQTPLQRILESTEVSDYTKEGLSRLLKQTNPFVLKRAIEKKIKLIFKVQNTRPQSAVG